MAAPRKNRAKSPKSKATKKHVHAQNSLTDLISRISQEIVDENCVLFVGAGSSTEKVRRGASFYSSIRSSTSFDDSEVRTFPEVMQKFCDERDGGHHNLLIREAIRYIEHFLLPGPDNRVASEFSRQVATIPFFKIVLTTNWDPLLERAMDVLVPMTQDRDVAFWDDRKKQVVKIHGCITRPHSIVATQGDYESCVTNNAILFNQVRALFATKTFLFTGYSLKDADFRELWESITSRLGQFSKLAYALDPFATNDDIEYWSKRGISIFRIRDVQFIDALRNHFVHSGLMPSERFIRFLMRERSRIVKVHLALEQNSDGAMASAMYQDGLLHELDDTLDAIRLGTKRQQDFQSELGFSLKQIKNAKKQRDPIEIAYWCGRNAVLSAYLEAGQEEIPTYFHPYNVTPIRRLVKGRIWDRIKSPHVHAGDDDGSPQVVSSNGEPFFAVCKHCAELLHKC